MTMFAAIKKFRRFFLPHGLSAQLLMFVGITAAFSAMTVGFIFTYDSVRHSRDQVNEEINFLGKNIAAMSGMLIISNDTPFLEDVLMLNAQLPIVSAILVVDDKGKILAEVVKQNGQLRVKKEIGTILPKQYDQSIDLISGDAANPSLLARVIPDGEILEMWHPVIAGRLLGSIRIRYSLADLRQTILSQWKQTFIYVALSVLSAFILLAVMLRAPMRALNKTTEFASTLGTTMGDKIPVYQGTREISKLTQALNNLSEQLLNQDKELADRIAQNQSILDNVVDGIISINAAGIILSFNHAAEGIFGYQQEEIIGKNIHTLMPDPVRLRDQAFIAQYGVSSITRAIGVTQESEAMRKDGSLFPMDLAVSKSLEHGEAIYIGVVRDITERRRLERLKTEFVSTVSHELRTPLTSIHGSLKLLEAGIVGALPPAALNLVKIAQQGSQRLILLINDLLDMEKLAAGKMALSLTQNNLSEIVAQSLQDNFGYGSNLNVRFVLGEHPPHLPVLVDAGRLAQVLANLLSNAAKFSGQSHQVDVRISSDQHYATVEIEDHGEGIPENFHKEMFGAFAQANSGNTRKQGGTGLGLKISKGLLEAMNGRIGFTTKIGSGTVFWFTLPIVTSDATINVEAQV